MTASTREKALDLPMSERVAAADGIGADRDKAVRDAERNLSAFLEQENARRWGASWVHSVHLHPGRNTLVAIVKVKVAPLYGDN